MKTGQRTVREKLWGVEKFVRIDVNRSSTTTPDGNAYSLAENKGSPLIT